SNFHSPLKPPTVMSNTPAERFETSIARAITANVSSDTAMGLSPAAVLIFDTSESGFQVVISRSSRFISSNTAFAASDAPCSSSVQMNTLTTVPIALSVYVTFAGAAGVGAAAQHARTANTVAARITASE